MTHFTSPSFWELYDKLPAPIQELADKNYKLLKTNPPMQIPHPLLEDWGDIQEVEIEQRAGALVVKPKAESSSRLHDLIIDEMKAAGLVEELPWTPPLAVSAEGRAHLAEKLSRGRPLSELILEDREERT